MKVVVTNSTSAAISNALIPVVLSDSSFRYSHSLSDGSDVICVGSDGISQIGFYTDKWKSDDIGVKAIRTSGIADYVYATGVSLGEMDLTHPGLELAAGFGKDLTISPHIGSVLCFSSDGTVLWTYNSPHTDYPMGITCGDVNGDGIDEVAVGFQDTDHCGVLLDNTGNLLWSWDGGSSHYVRSASIGEVRSDYAGKEVIFGNSAGRIALLSSSGAVIWSTVISTAQTIQRIEIADINQDGENEIIVAHQDGTVKAVDNAGNIIWSSPIVGDIMGLSVGNASSDTGLEILVPSSRSHTNRVSLLNSAGTVLWYTNYDYMEWSTAIGNIDGGIYSSLFVGYGTHDILSPSPSDSGGLARLDSSGSVLSYVPLPSSVGLTAFGDADNDGYNEVVSSCDDGNVYIVGTHNSKVYLSIPSFASNSTTTAYLYYGNPTHNTSSSDGQFNPIKSWSGIDGSQPSGWTDKLGDWAIVSNFATSPDSGNSGNMEAIEKDTTSLADFKASVVMSKPHMGDGGSPDYYVGIYYRIQSWASGYPTAYRVLIGAKGNCYLDRVTQGTGAQTYAVASNNLGYLYSLGDVLTVTITVTGDVHKVEVSVNGKPQTGILGAVDSNVLKISGNGTFACFNNRGQTEIRTVSLQPIECETAGILLGNEEESPGSFSATEFHVGTIIFK